MTNALAVKSKTAAPACRINSFRKSTASAYRSVHTRPTASIAVRREEKALPMLVLRGPVRTSFAGLI